MTHHGFAVGDNVRYAERQFPNVVWEADYTIVNALPADRHGARYVIRCAEPEFDRVVREQELSPVQAGVVFERRLALPSRRTRHAGAGHAESAAPVNEVKNGRRNV
jgi:hypothetical protein